MERAILTTGGTGGHIFPALAVAEQLRRRCPEMQLLFVGSLYGPEGDLATQAGLDFAGLPVRGFLGRGFRAVGAAAGMARALVEAVALMRRFRPQVVAGFGGYAAFAPVLASSLCGIPAVVHEQNALAGVSNRFLGRLARRICLSLEGTEGFPSRKCVLTGNPVRRAVVEIGAKANVPGTRRLLVMGGSQGARALNECVMASLPRLRAGGVELRVQTGSGDAARVREACMAVGYDGACVESFITDMAAAYGWADLALCRAGATSVAELAASGTPAVLVPFPFATHDHQTCNARVLAASGAALLVPEKEMSRQDVAGLLLALLNDAGRLGRMREAALAQARPDAAERVADVLFQASCQRG